MIRLAPALLLLIACEPPELTAACDAAVDADLSGSLIEGPVDDVVDSELVVQGSASHARGLAIRPEHLPERRSSLLYVLTMSSALVLPRPRFLPDGGKPAMRSSS